MYGKLFSTMYDGTLGTRGPWEALVTFQQLIILADQDGVVDMTAEAIARRTTIPLDIVTKGLAALEQPDPDSRTPDEAGRRIVRLSTTRAWGWRLVNYAHYRAIRTAEERRAYMRKYQRERRAKAAVNTVNRLSTKSTNSSKQKEKKKEKQFKTVADRTLQPERGKGNGENLSLPAGKVTTGDQASASLHQGSNPAQQEKANGQTLETWAEANGITRSGRETEDAYRRRCIDAFVKFKAAQAVAQ